MVIDAFVGNVIVLSQTVSSNIKGFVVSDILTMTDVVRKNIVLQSVGHVLPLSSRPGLRRSVTLVSVTSVLPLTEKQARNKYGDVVQALGIYHSLRTVKGGNIGQTLTLAQLINGWKSKELIQSISFTQSISRTIRRSLTVNQTLILLSKQAVFKPNKNFIGVSLTAITPQKPVLSFANVSITLRSPEWGNTERVDSSRILRKSRAGTLIVYRQPTWPRSETLTMQISDLQQEQCKKLLDFMSSTIGRTVQFADHEGKHWQGYIMTPAAQVAEQYRNNFVVNLEFQGSQV